MNQCEHCHQNADKLRPVESIYGPMELCRTCDSERLCAVWTRVSTSEQDSKNQLLSIHREIDRRGLLCVRVFDFSGSAFRGAHRKLLSEVYESARLGRYQTLVIWSLDRLSREGVSETLEIVRRLAKSGVNLLSTQESWLEQSGELRELLLSLVSWVAKFESERRSERTKAGLERAKASGKKLGRPTGAKDSKKRKKSGYFRRWSEHQEQTAAD